VLVSLRAVPVSPLKSLLLHVALGDEDRPMIADAVNALMGSKPELRFKFIQDRAAFAKDLDI
jgi:topoisomerase IV subunit B